MKRAVISTIFSFVYLFSIAQDSNHDTANKTYIAALKQPIEVSEDNLISNSSYNLMDDDGSPYITQ